MWLIIIHRFWFVQEYSTNIFYENTQKITGLHLLIKEKQQKPFDKLLA